LYCIVLYCIVLYCIVLYLSNSSLKAYHVAYLLSYCIVLHCIVLHCIALHCIVLYCIVSGMGEKVSENRLIGQRNMIFLGDWWRNLGGNLDKLRFFGCFFGYRIVLYCIVVYYIVLYCIVLYNGDQVSENQSLIGQRNQIVLHCIVL